MIRVLQIFGSSNPGGAETLITSILENINREDIMFDFLILDSHIGALENKWRELGSNIYHIKKYNIFTCCNTYTFIPRCRDTAVLLLQKFNETVLRAKALANRRSIIC